MYRNLRSAVRRFSTAAGEIIDIKDPRHPQHPANWDPTFPKAGPPLPQAWSEDPRNFGRVHPVLKGWIAVVAAGLLWSSALTFFASSVRGDPAEHWKQRQGGKEAPTKRTIIDRPGAARVSDMPTAPAPAAPSVAGFKAWLEGRGVQLGRIDVTAASTSAALSANAGLGCVVTPSGPSLGSLKQPGGGWFSRSSVPVLARLPLDVVLTAENLMRQTAYGSVLHDAAEARLLDGRGAIMFALALERARGSASPYLPYIQALPPTHAFTTPITMKDGDLVALRGTPLYEATLKMKERLAKQFEQLGPFFQKAAKEAGSADRTVTFDDWLWAFNVFWTRAHQLPTGEDGLIPLVDFCNHSFTPSARWELVEGGRDAPHIALVSTSPSLPPASHELTISYGDKSDEELLFLHGFAMGRNPYNRLLVHMDPMSLGLRNEEALEDRRELMMLRGHSPFLYLPNPEEVGAGFPMQALRFAEVLSLSNPDFAKALQAAREGTATGGETEGDAWAQFKRRPLSEQMAILSVLRGLMEQTVDHLEHDSYGSGSLERDIALLQKNNLDAKLLPCVVYRAGLKRMAREWLVRAKAELQDVMAQLRPL